MKKESIETKLLNIFSKKKFIYCAEQLHNKEELKGYKLSSIKKVLSILKKKDYLYINFRTKRRYNKNDNVLNENIKSGKTYYGVLEK